MAHWPSAVSESVSLARNIKLPFYFITEYSNYPIRPQTGCVFSCFSCDDGKVFFNWNDSLLPHLTQAAPCNFRHTQRSFFDDSCMCLETAVGLFVSLTSLATDFRRNQRARARARGRSRRNPIAGFPAIYLTTGGTCPEATCTCVYRV